MSYGRAREPGAGAQSKAAPGGGCVFCQWCAGGVEGAGGAAPCECVEYRSRM